LILLLGLSKDKDIESVCRYLAPIADEIVLSRASVDRAADPHLIKGYIKDKRVRVTGDVAEALGVAFRAATENDIILATGSFFIISEVRKMVLGAEVRVKDEVAR
jgi:dihydrofolate synthase/folylpolyglutamate synthase